ncbi:MAG: hypothetical protein HY904_24780 [Deltaproteobacteria bacterium]|nr:hypothetical protein [Deltaproteobacteria bacterium]
MRGAWALAALAVLLWPARSEARLGGVTVEARVGPYVPDLDPYRGANALDTSEGVTGFSCEFGFGVRPMAVVSPQLTVFDMLGTITLGGEVGFYTIRARKLFNPTDCTSGTGLTTEELSIVPLMATATYRFDWALKKFQFPVVPYGRLGLGGAGWLITNDGKPADSQPTPVVDENGNPVRNSDGEAIYARRDPVGFSFGGKLALGMMVALDFLEPMRALQARAKGIYQNSFVFLELAAFDAGMYQNALISLVAPRAKDAGIPMGSYFGPTLIVGSERLPLLTGGIAITF